MQTVKKLLRRRNVGLGGIVADGLDGTVRVVVFVCMREVRLWRGI